MREISVKKIMPRLAALLLAVVLLAGFEAAPANGAAKYIFLFIGDGMGTAQRNAAEMYLAGMREARGDVTPREAQLAMNLLPVQGFIETDSLSGITDSAAAGTALATGHKARNGVVAMNPKSGENYVSIAEMAHRKGMKTGIVTSSFFQDATPAAFYGHAGKRTEHYSLGIQLTGSGYEYFGGGGFRNPKGRDKKSADLYGIASSKGYAVTRDLGAPIADKVIAVHPRASNGYMPWVIDERSGPSLADLVDYGIETLDGRDGFFMMVEGGKIDLACHAHDAAATVRETMAFDEAVERAVKFMETRPGSTLIVVTGDHETGGMALSSLDHAENAVYDTLSLQQGSYAVFERRVSPKKGEKMADYVNTAKKFFGPWIAAAPDIERAFKLSAMAAKSRKSAAANYDKLYSAYDPFTIACMASSNAHCGITWSTFGHTGKKVPVSAAGIKSESFAGEYENTGIYDRILSAMAD
ncbi:MAG: alkaline phosphatase [Synergistaceae bacterium]|jgi:alkaline phosphatase|nr:alkaline phosphatase [Synergistaceae bacterium]MDR1515530.1 alkaline phosphatase [Synergistaceae bacterium]